MRRGDSTSRRAPDRSWGVAARAPGQYPQIYDAIMSYAREVAPASVIAPLDSSLQRALLNKGTAATAVAISVAVAPYGTTGVLEAARRGLNVGFEVEGGGGVGG